MSRETWNELITGTVPGLEGLSELAQLAQEARLARDLAADECHEGTWVDETEAPAAVQRLAASDQAQTVTYRSGPWTVTLSGAPGAWSATLTAGEPGAALSVAGSEVDLVLERPVTVPGLGPAPERLALITAAAALVIMPRV